MLVAPCVACVFGVGGGVVVFAVSCFFGTHVEVVVVVVVEYGVDGFDGWCSYGSRG